MLLALLFVGTGDLSMFFTGLVAKPEDVEADPCRGLLSK
jgi:hypothetical protein